MIHYHGTPMTGHDWPHLQLARRHAMVSGKLRTEPFLDDVMAKPKLFIIGNAHDLEELARHQP